MQQINIACANVKNASQVPAFLNHQARELGYTYRLQLARGYFTFTGDDEGYPVWKGPSESHRETSMEQISKILNWGDFSVFRAYPGEPTGPDAPLEWRNFRYNSVR